MARGWLVPSSGPESWGPADPAALGLSCVALGSAVLGLWVGQLASASEAHPPEVQVWAPSPLMWMHATELQVSAGAAYPGFTVQGLSGDGHQSPGLLQRVLYLAPDCLYFLFLFEKFFLFKPPGPNKHLAAHSSAWLSPKNPAADPAPGPGL